MSSPTKTNFFTWKSAPPGYVAFEMTDPSPSSSPTTPTFETPLPRSTSPDVTVATYGHSDLELPNPPAYVYRDNEHERGHERERTETVRLVSTNQNQNSYPATAMKTYNTFEGQQLGDEEEGFWDAGDESPKKCGCCRRLLGCSCWALCCPLICSLSLCGFLCPSGFKWRTFTKSEFKYSKYTSLSQSEEGAIRL